jgi:hypothetical protein
MTAQELKEKWEAALDEHRAIEARQWLKSMEHGDLPDESLIIARTDEKTEPKRGKCGSLLSYVGR